MKTKQINILAILLVTICSFFTTKSYSSSDEIVSLSLERTTVGYEETPVINLQLSLNKRRDLHVAIQKVGNNRPVKTVMKRIKKSGNYHFNLDIDGIKPGKYRVNSYLTPKGKNWNDRIGETQSLNITILDKPIAPEESKYADKDLIKNITWPKKISDDGEVILTANFDISQKRDLHLKLFNSDNWQELGAIKYTVNTSGDISVPVNNLVTNFSEGKYAWVVYLTEVGASTEVTKKQGRHFVIDSK